MITKMFLLALAICKKGILNAEDQKAFQNNDFHFGDTVSGEREDTWPATLPFVLANWRIIDYEQQSKCKPRPNVGV
jgi:hypothetical protein